MYSLITKTSNNWKAHKSGNLNRLNTFCLFDEDISTYDIPVVESSEDFCPEDLISFNGCANKRVSDKDKTVHFFIDDYKFEPLWANPSKYVSLFQFYNGIISPTFSVWSNQPQALNIFNMYRSHWCTRFFQEHGINVLTDVRWADESTYDICFDGVKKHSPVIVNTVGTYMKENRKLFTDGFFEMIRRIEPSKLYVYGEYLPVKFEDYFDEVTYFESFWKKQRDKINLKKGDESNRSR